MAVERENTNGIGNVKISDDVIAAVSQVALEGIDGVYGIADNTKNLAFGIKTFTKSVRAEMKEGFVIIDIDVVVNYGANIGEVAWEIQSRIKKEVEVMTGLVVQKVNVNVKDVHIEEKKEETE